MTAETFRAWYARSWLIPAQRTAQRFFRETGIEIDAMAYNRARTEMRKQEQRATRAQRAAADALNAIGAKSVMDPREYLERPARAPGASRCKCGGFPHDLFCPRSSANFNE